MASTSPLDLQAIHDHAVSLARAAGRYLREETNKWRLSRQQRTSTEKLNSVDLVTESDVHVEKLIREGVLEAYPEHKFIGEESYSAGSEKRFLLTDDPTWIVDPIDGTVNTVHHFPMTAISIGFCVNSVPTVGVVFAPFLGLHGTLYSAILGVGAWMAESIPSAEYTPMELPYFSPPPPLPESAPKGCLYLGEWGKERRDIEGGNLSKKANTFWNMASEQSGRGGKGGQVHGIRSLGSSTMDMVYVASGQADIMFEAGCWEWDVCAGICILLQCGGIVVDSNPVPGLKEGEPIPMANLGGRRYLAIRGCSDTAEKSARQQQEELVWKVWKSTERMGYSRPGLE